MFGVDGGSTISSGGIALYCNVNLFSSGENHTLGYSRASESATTEMGWVAAVSDSDEQARHADLMALPLIRSTLRMTLHPLTMEHSGGMFGMWSDPDVCRYSGQAHDRFGDLIHLPARTPTDSDKIIEFFLRRSDEEMGFRWAMLEKRTGKFLGAIGYNHLSPKAEIAYHLSPAAWGNGYAHEALEEALRWAAEVKIRHVEAWIEPNNRRSIALITKANFSPTGAVSEDACEFVRLLG